MKSKLRLVSVFAPFLAFFVEGCLGIILGAPASPGEFPYVVGIGQFRETGDPSICTGGIIDEKFVITAAHCVSDAVETSAVNMITNKSTSKSADIWVFVYANTTNYQDDLRKNMEESRLGLNRTTTKATSRRAVKGHILSEYFINGHADIAILELESPLNLNDGYHQKLKLPSGRKISYEGVQAVVAGYGDDYAERNDDGFEHVNDGGLKKAHFRIVPELNCFPDYYSSDARGDSLCMVAVTEDNKRPDHPLGACGGDSGSPVVRGNTMIGIMMSIFPESCDARENSRGYTLPQSSVKVKYYKDFINNVIGNRHWRPMGNNQTITEFKFKA